MKFKVIISLILFFLSINGTVYFITTINQQQRIKLSLDDNIQTLQIHYNILHQTQKITAQTLYQSTVNMDRFLEIMSQARTAPEDEQKVLRDEMKELLTFKYNGAIQKGVLQYHFVFPDNRVFLRMHKPEKFGDDLTEVRDDFNYTNRTKKEVRTFTQGRTAHGFRNTFPIFDKESNHIGAMEVSFSSDSFQWYLNNISNIHTHFLVDKTIFNAKTWARDDLIIKYSQSAESSSHMMTLGDMHSKKQCIDDNIVKLKPIQKELEQKMKEGDPFALYTHVNNSVEVLAFLPIKNLQEKTIAWLVSYEDAPFIAMTIRGGYIIRSLAFLISLTLVSFIIMQIRSRSSLESKHKLLDDILNATDNIIFITDFKSVNFSNDKFKNLVNVKSTVEFNEKVQGNILSLFNKKEGCLHNDLLKNGEAFTTLVQRTPEDERVVSLIDKEFHAKVFNISISQTNYDADYYLVTLSDITKLKEKQEKTEKKAYFDGLTNVYNRNKFDEILEVELQRSKRYAHPLSIAIIDIDKFKNFNDTYGHLIGDEVLILMAQSVNTNVRATDTFARWGGEEFVILFRDTLVEDAKIVSEKLRDTISKLSHHTAGSVTASFGLTSYKEDDTSESLFKRCDEALYLAKANGRNKVEVL